MEMGRAGGAGGTSPRRALQAPQDKVLLQNEHQDLLLAAWKVLRRNVAILPQLGVSREEVKSRIKLPRQVSWIISEDVESSLERH